MPIRVSAIFICVSVGFEQSQSQYAGGILLPPVQKLVATFISVPNWGRNTDAPHPLTVKFPVFFGISGISVCLPVFRTGKFRFFEQRICPSLRGTNAENAMLSICKDRSDYFFPIY